MPKQKRKRKQKQKRKWDLEWVCTICPIHHKLGELGNDKCARCAYKSQYAKTKEEQSKYTERLSNVELQDTIPLSSCAETSWCIECCQEVGWDGKTKIGNHIYPIGCHCDDPYNPHWNDELSNK